MPTNDQRDIARVIKRLRDDLRRLQEGNQPDEELAVTREETETTAVDDTLTAVESPTGDLRYLKYTTDDGAELLKEQVSGKDVATDIGLAECGP